MSYISPATSLTTIIDIIYKEAWAAFQARSEDNSRSSPPVSSQQRASASQQ